MKKIRKYPFSIIMFALVFGMFFISVIKKDTKFSELENRYLTTKPRFTLSGFIDSSYGDQYERYINEQFPFRNDWITTKANTEYLLGKAENNGVIKGKNNYLFNKQLSIDKQLQKNIKAIKAFAKQSDIDISLSVVPNSYDVLKKYVPFGAPNVDQEASIIDSYDQLQGINNLKLIPLHTILKAHSDEYIYYRTDHHWTSLGAYYGYLQYCKEQEIEPIQLEALKANHIPDFYGTYYSKYKGAFINSDEITYYDIPIDKMLVEGQETHSLYDMDKVKTRDKYAMFMHGNPSLSIIYSEKSEVNAGKKLLIIKDSYANSMIPFLTYNYEEIYVVDLRYFGESVSDLIKKHEIDSVFILYNYDTLMTDNHFYRLSR